MCMRYPIFLYIDELDEKIKGGKEIRDACPYRTMCGNPHSFCADNLSGCQCEWQHFVNNTDCRIEHADAVPAEESHERNP